jgi:murein DD-endopeptidase MepM/ murein hydrolase activator NlpD
MPASPASSPQQDPLAFFEEPRPRGENRGRRLLFLAGGAGLLTGLAAVALFVTLMEGRSTAAIRSGEGLAALGWQRPVISDKSDLEAGLPLGSMQAGMLTLPPLSGGSAERKAAEPEPLLESAALPVDSPTSLMTRFAALSPEEAIVRSPSPRILDGAYYLSDEPAAARGNETVIAKQPPAEPVDRTFTLGKNETLLDKLMALGVSETVARALVSALEPVFPQKLLRPGTRFSVTLDTQQDFYGADVTYPVYLAFAPRAGERIIVEVDEDGNFVARAERQAVAGNKAGEKKAPSAPALVRARGVITSTLYAAARDKGVPGYIINQMLRAFAYDVDLQREVSKGDTFEVLYGTPRSGSSRRRMVLYYAALTLRGKKHEIFRFTPPGSRTAAYYDGKGRSVKKGLMRTPISGARITSGFGMRRHPILGYTKLHTGVDFAAPRGTPIRAAGDGIVIHAGWKGGYGRTVMIRHANGYVTLYAHQSRIARGIRKGVRVRQGQVIGYLGSSGRVTGPHLHYEIRIGNRPVNPMRVRVATRVRLKGRALKAFERHKQKILAQLRETPVGTTLARRD